MKPYFSSWIEIDLSRFQKNLETIREKIHGAFFCLPLKANAYGHGLVEMAHASKDRVDYLAVSNALEGISLRKANISLPILVLGAFQIDQIEAFIEYDLEFTLSSLYKAKEVAKYCDLKSKKAKVHLEIDTGMRRTGMRCESAKALVDYVLLEKCFLLKGIYSHFASADEVDNFFTNHQISSFENFLKNFSLPKNIIRHIANSAGLLYFPNSILDMVRPGLLSYGYFPSKKIENWDIAPCFELKSKVSYFKVVKENEGISYNHRYISKNQSRIVTIPIGYGDGYRRVLSNIGRVLIRGKKYPIAGNICMDQFMVDIGKDEAYVGDEVVLIGKMGEEKITVEEIASLYHTIPYEVLCSFNERIVRIYKETKLL